MKSSFISPLLTGATLLLLLGTNGCREDDVKVPACYLKTMEIVEMFGSGLHVQYSFDYTDRMKLSSGTLSVSWDTSPGSLSEYILTADADGLMNHIVHASTGDNYYDFFYNAKHQVTEWIGYYGGNDSRKDMFTYDPSGRLVKINKYISWDTNGPYELFEYANYKYDNQTVLTPKSNDQYWIDLVSGQEHLYAYTYEFDEKKSPMNDLPLGLPYAPAVSVNNLTNSTFDLMGSMHETVFTHQYNSQGYPTQSTGLEKLSNATSQKTTYTYTYDCK